MSPSSSARLAALAALAAQLVLGSAQPAHAQSRGARLVRDLNLVVQSPSSRPQSFARLGNEILFAATRAGSGTEIFATSGAAGPVRLVKDIRAGSASGIGSGFERITIANGRAWFPAVDGFGEELWTSDGTTAGTAMVKDLAPGSTNGFPAVITPFQGRMLFRARDGVHGDELWISDGTAAGTSMVLDIAPGSASSYVWEIAVIGAHAYFSATGGLWRTDGTANGTALVSAPGLTDATDLRAVGSTLFFRGGSAASGYELWRTSGSSAQQVAEISAGAFNADPRELVELGGALYFFATDSSGDRELWRSDGTSGGTQRVSDVSLAGTWPRELVVAGSALYFAAQPDAGAHRLFVSDGTSAGTRSVVPLTSSVQLVEPRSLGAVGSAIFFEAAFSNGTVAPELFRSDGTQAGTWLVRDVFPGVGSSAPSGFFDLMNGRALFAADDGITGIEPWISDGTLSGTVRLDDVNTLVGRSMSSAPRDFVGLDGSALFTADDGIYGRELWRTDGTGAGTSRVIDLRPGPEGSMIVPQFFRIGARVFFSADDGTHGEELWITDGSAAGTQLVADLSVGTASSWPSDFRELRGELAFSAASRIYLTDGTSAGTRLLHPAARSAVVEYRGALWFAGADNQHGTELWRSDGTAAGTQLFLDIDPIVTARGPYSSSPGELTVWNDRLFFAAETEPEGREPWICDATTAGTVRLADTSAGYLDGNPRELTPWRGALYFAAETGLWRSDGTSAGTLRLSTSLLGVQELTPLESQLVFTSWNQMQDRELAVSDGTVAGTRRLLEIHPTASGETRFLRRIGERRIVLQATDGVAGPEPWYTDGTAGGTRRLLDVQPGSTGSYAWQFANVGGKLLASADDGLLGAELWWLEAGAMTQSLGAGCGAASPAPSIALSDPVIGASARLDARDAPPFAFCVLLASAPAPYPIRLPGWSCATHLDFASARALAYLGSVPAAWSASFPIPRGIANGAALTLEAWYVPSAPLPAAIEVTNAIVATFGW